MPTTAEIRNPVDPPQVRPRLHGLTTTFQPRDLEAHDRLGVTWPGNGACNGVVSTTDDECLSDASQVALTLAAACLAGHTADRHTIYSFVRRSMFDKYIEDPAYVSSPNNAFDLSEAPKVESLFWDDVTAAADTISLGPQATPLDALAEVEQWLAENYNGLGVIHVTPRVAVLLGDDGLVRPSGVLTTRTGTPVVIGAGYDGTTKAITGTGTPVLYRAGTPTRIESNDLSANDGTVLIQRTWLIGWDCAAVQATIT